VELKEKAYQRIPEGRDFLQEQNPIRFDGDKFEEGTEPRILGGGRRGLRPKGGNLLEKVRETSSALRAHLHVGREKADPGHENTGGRIVGEKKLFRLEK